MTKDERHSSSPDDGTPSTRTAPDEAPAVHVREAANRQDRRETEDLLSGFDRPSRGPKRPEANRDFVDYYANKKDRVSAPAPLPVTIPGVVAPSERNAETFVLVRPEKRKAAPLLPWVLVTLGMIALGGLIAFIATSDSPRTADAPTAPSAATTISSTQPISTRTDTNDVPPPDPAQATPSVITADPPPRGSLRRRSASAEPATSSPPSSNKPPPRDDFIRDL